MAKNEITNAEILEAISKGFEHVEGRLNFIEGQLRLLDDRVSVLEAQHKEVVTRISQVPDVIEETYGRMLNEHEDRLRALESS